MPTAKFIADFSSFTDAVNKASITLTNVEANANKVGKALNAMVDNFSGRKLINDAVLMTKAVEDVGGASKLTATEMAKVNGVVSQAIEKYTALGKVAPKSMTDLAEATKKTESASTGFSTAMKTAEGTTGGLASGLGKVNSALAALGVGLSVGAVVSFGKEIFRMGDEFQKMADKAGMSTTEVQRLAFVGDQTGVSFEGLIGATQNLQMRLGGDDKGLAKAVEHLGLNLAEIKAKSPYEQMITLATALTGLKDPTDFAATAADLFGKSWKEITPAILGNMDEIAKRAPVMSEATVQALDKAGDAMSELALTFKVGAANAYLWIREKFDQMIAVIYNASAAFIDAEAKMLGWIMKMPGGTAAANALGISVKELTEGAQWFRDAAKGMAPPLETVTDNVKKLAPAMKDVAEHTGKAAANTEKATIAIDAFVGPLQAVLKSTDTWGMGIGQLNSRLVDVTGTIGDLTPELQDLVTGFEDVDRTEQNLKRSHDALLASMNKPMTLPDVKPALDEIGGAFESLKGIAGSVLGGLNDIFQRAFEGGGNIMGAIKSFATNALKVALSFIPVIGPFISQFAGAIVAGFDKIFGGIFKSAEKAMNKVRQTFVDAAGGLDTLRDKATAAGVTINALLDAKTAKQYEAAIRDLNAAFEEHEKDVTRAKELIDEYGLSIEQLGPKWRAQELDTQVQGLMNDLRIMVDVLGLSMPDALTEMGSKFQAAFDTALKFGMELPAQMQPILEKMVELGLLMDENGEVVTDLQDTGVTFAESFAKSIDRLIDKFDEFLQRLGMVPDRLDTDIYTHHHDDWDSNAAAAGAAMGGLVTATGIQNFARGGNVLPFRPRGTDTVPAMLTPGEGVLTRAEMHALGGVAGFKSLRESLRTGGAVGGDSSALEMKLDAILGELRRNRINGPAALGRAVRDEVQKVPRSR